jgi:hypothetical protein
VFSGARALPRCRKYEARLAALEDSRLAGRLLREVWEPKGELAGVFVQRVRGVMRSDLSSKTLHLLSVFGRRGYEK